MEEDTASVHSLREEANQHLEKKPMALSRVSFMGILPDPVDRQYQITLGSIQSYVLVRCILLRAKDRTADYI